MPDNTEIKVDIESLRKDIENMNTIHNRLDTAIDKLTDVSTSIKSMLAVHEEKIARQEKIDEIIFEKLKDRADEISDVYTIQNIRKTEILAASVRDVKTVSDSFASGAHVVTMPPAVFEKMYNHVLTDKGLYLFDMDWAKVKR